MDEPNMHTYPHMRMHTHMHTHTTFTFRMFSYGEYKAEDQEDMLTALDAKLAEVYSKSIGPSEANLK